MARIVFTPDEIEEVRALLRETAERYGSVEDEAFLDETDVIAHDLPRRIRREIRRFKRINVVRDLRKSRESRLSAASRVLY